MDLEPVQFGNAETPVAEPYSQIGTGPLDANPSFFMLRGHHGADRSTVEIVRQPS